MCWIDGLGGRGRLADASKYHGGTFDYRALVDRSQNTQAYHIWECRRVSYGYMDDMKRGSRVRIRLDGYVSTHAFWLCYHI